MLRKAVPGRGQPRRKGVFSPPAPSLRCTSNSPPELFIWPTKKTNQKCNRYGRIAWPSCSGSYKDSTALEEGLIESRERRKRELDQHNGVLEKEGGDDRGQEQRDAGGREAEFRTKQPINGTDLVYPDLPKGCQISLWPSEQQVWALLHRI